MPSPFANPSVSLESDEPVTSTKNRVAAVRVKGAGGNPEVIKKIVTSLMSLRYGANVTTTPTEASKGDGFFVVHYQGKPLAEQEVVDAVLKHAMWGPTRKLLGR